ncbi:MAG: hypothetical protein QM598_05840 [Protaetiibacter sp.]
MATDGRDEIGAELLSQLTEDAQLLEVRDEAEDIALDLHEQPFSPGARTRALSFFDSNRYRTAAAAFSSRSGVEAS